MTTQQAVEQFFGGVGVDWALTVVNVIVGVTVLTIVFFRLVTPNRIIAVRDRILLITYVCTHMRRLSRNKRPCLYLVIHR